MATIVYYLDDRRENKRKEYVLKMSVTHRGKRAYIPLNFRVAVENWSKEKERVIKHPHADERNLYLGEIKTLASTKILELSKNGELNKLTATELRDTLERFLFPSIEDEEEEKKDLLLPFFASCVELKKAPRTKEVYQSTMEKIRAYAEDAEDLTFSEVNKSWLQGFELFLSRSLKANTVAIHLRNLRSVFNDAIDNEITENYPFRKFKIKHEETQKRSLDVEELRTLFNYEVEEHAEKYIDIFKLSFFLIGINPIDLFQLKEIEKDRIVYNRAKTGKLYSVKVEKEAKEIIEKYKGEKHLLCVLDKYKNYRDFLKKVNKALQTIGEVKIGKQGKKTYTPIFPNISIYWARHTWATIAHKIGVPKDVISLALGHSFGVDTTDIYIRYDRDKIDDANRRVIDYVLYGMV